MDFSEYADIAPYRGQQVLDAVGRVKENFGAIAQLIGGAFRGVEEEKAEGLFREMSKRLDQVRSYDDFQRLITAGLFLPAILKNSATGFSVSGLENLEKDEAYFFISDHRDIILDCALIDLALGQGGMGMCEMAIGDNLLYNSFVKDLFKLNGGGTVKRTLPLREKYMESIRLSKYFVEIITEAHHSIWCAQKSGRSKDGIDDTNPAIIKMLYLSKRHSGISFGDLIKSCHIVPVAVSYQYDPNDINKGREEVAIAQNGSHQKRHYEDMISMARGITRNKGHIHIAFGTPLVDDYGDAKEVAEEIDRQIHLNYRLYDTNYFAYDYLEGGNRFTDKYRDFDHDVFLKRYEDQRPEVRTFILNMFANPVRSYLGALEK